MVRGVPSPPDPLSTAVERGRRGVTIPPSPPNPLSAAVERGRRALVSRGYKGGRALPIGGYGRSSLADARGSVSGECGGGA